MAPPRTAAALASAVCLLLALTTADAQGTELVTPLHGGTPRIEIELQIFDGREWKNADSAVDCPKMLNTTNGRVQYRAIINNAGTVDLTSITVRAQVSSTSNTSTSYSSLLKGKSLIWTLPTRSWSRGLVSRTAWVTAKYRTTTVSKSDPAHYSGLAPSMQIQLQVRDDNGLWRNADSPSSSPVLGREFAQQRRNNSVQLRLQLNNTGNVDLLNLALGGNWRGAASTGTITSLVVGSSVNVGFDAPYQMIASQNRTASVLARISDRSRTLELQLSNAVFWRAATLLATFLDIDSDHMPDSETFVAADTNSSALRIPMQHLEDVRFRATAMNTGNTALYVRLNAGSGVTKAETVQPGQNITLRFARNYECGADLGDMLAASLSATTTYNGVTITNTNPAFFTFFADLPAPPTP